MEVFSLLALIITLIGVETVILLARSSLKFTKGEIQKITSNFVWGTIFMFGAMLAQFQVEFFTLSRTPIDVVKYILMFVGFSYYLHASFRIYRMSKVLGFASKDIPEKLKRILKS